MLIRKRTVTLEVPVGNLEQNTKFQSTCEATIVEGKLVIVRYPTICKTRQDLDQMIVALKELREALVKRGL